jgi:syntaxin 1B/2/3
MSQLSKSSSSLDRNDPNAILNECRDIDRAIDGVQGNLDTLRMLQDRSLIEADATSTRRELDNLSSSTMSMFRDLTERVRMVKSVREGRQPRNAAQVGRVERRLKEANQEYQQVESAFRKKTQDQMARQYRIVRPNASESEVRSAVEDTSGNAQVFQQALMQGNRMGEATSTLNAVRARQQDMQKIEQTLGELVQLFTDLSVMIEQQETQFVDISQKTEAVEEDTRQANVEIGTAVHTAVKTRKKKWICLSIGGKFSVRTDLEVTRLTPDSSRHSRHHCRRRCGVHHGQSCRHSPQEAQPRPASRRQPRHEHTTQCCFYRQAPVAARLFVVQDRGPERRLQPGSLAEGSAQGGERCEALCRRRRPQRPGSLIHSSVKQWLVLCSI